MIHRITVKRINADFSETQLFSFRIGGTQKEAEDCGEMMRTRWMKANPGIPTTMTTNWPTSEELGGKFCHKDNNYAPLPIFC